MKGNRIVYTSDDIISLMREHLSGEMDELRQKELRAWTEESRANKDFFLKICSEHTFREHYDLWSQIDTRAAIRKFDRRTSGFIRQRWLIGTSVAAVILLGVILSFLLTGKEEYRVPEIVRTEIMPGSSKAVLIIAGKQQIELTEYDSLFVTLPDGHLATNRDKQLVYETGNSTITEFHELKTPRGGEYQVVLSDGSVIRLNSGSSLKYPVIFSGERREVELTGEAYFKVAKGTIPFYVKSGDMAVIVYGTTFNINTHLPGYIQTALVEGRVGITVKGKTEETILTPSQIADFNAQTLSVDVRQTDLFPYTAWTNGLFIFTNETLEQIMNTLSLWYDIDVFFQNPDLQQLHFTGCVKRYECMDQILGALSRSVGVKFSQQGKTLIISN